MFVHWFPWSELPECVMHWILKYYLLLFSFSNLSFNEISLGIEDIGGPFNRLASLNRLDLQHNRIRTILKQNFQGLTRLHVLQLNDNQISSIQANAFESLTELRELWAANFVDNKYLINSWRKIAVFFAVGLFCLFDLPLTPSPGNPHNQYMCYEAEISAVRG